MKKYQIDFTISSILSCNCFYFKKVIHVFSWKEISYALLDIMPNGNKKVALIVDFSKDKCIILFRIF